jgi:hypothetical protein
MQDARKRKVRLHRKSGLGQCGRGHLVSSAPWLGTADGRIGDPVVWPSIAVSSVVKVCSSDWAFGPGLLSPICSEWEGPEEGLKSYGRYSSSSVNYITS